MGVVLRLDIPLYSAKISHLLRFVSFLAATASAMPAQDVNFAGAMIGVSTLSADGRSVIDSTNTSVSLYKPENALTWFVFAGRHLNDFLSAQVSYTRNRNDLTLTSVQVTAGIERSYEQSFSARHDTIAGEFMLYFRPRSSRARPYLSAGPGVARLSSTPKRTVLTRGSPVLPVEFSSTHLCFRVAVGIDLQLRRSVAFRYTFAETIQNNSISAHLSPPGRRNLANFQNLFGLVWRF